MNEVQEASRRCAIMEREVSSGSHFDQLSAFEKALESHRIAKAQEAVH
jgi:hypothetical protein